ncbi:MAG: DUF362 domain-containing protein [Thermoguttaceae bacterium]|jgi:uncharacterized protein (DUF362 family)
MELPEDAHNAGPCKSPAVLDRRALLVGAGAALAGVLGLRTARRNSPGPKPVFLARGQRYDGPLADTIRRGLLEVGFDPAMVRGRRVLLKPNLVEPTRESPHATTHPAVVVAAADVFRGWGAEVAVGEGPGHVRDSEMALVESGLDDALRAAGLPFLDLNYCDARPLVNHARNGRLEQFFLPQPALEADLIVSLPKLKTHHWVGLTASMKNLFGLLPGMIYGWPKNVLHYAGIPETIADINALLPQTIGIVDGIVCMEGDGPIMGTPKPMGMLAVGLNLSALDATCARTMAINPARVGYLAQARLGPVADGSIPQRGERWQDLASPFAMLDAPHLRLLRAGLSLESGL